MAITALLAAPALIAAQTRSWPSESPPRPLPAREVRFPPYELQTLPNGLQVIAVEHHEQPIVSMRMLVRAGAVHDPKGKGGVSALVAALLDQGTAKRTAQELADTIDFIGGELGAGAGSDLTFAYVLVMKDSLDLGMELLSEMVRTPAFAQEELDRQRQQLVSTLRVSYEDPEYVANVVFDRLVYGFHPYGMPNSGTPESLARITREDLAAFHRAYFVPNNAILAIVGDILPRDAFALAARRLGDWTPREVVAPAPPDPPPPTRRVVVVDKPDAVQTEIRVGHIGLPRKHPDYMALNLAMKILGGEGANRLHRVLRSERGLTYGAQAEFETFKLSGHFGAETDTRSEATSEVLRLMVEEFGRIQREPVFEGELHDAKAYLAGSFPLTIETPNAIATQVLNAVFYELPLKELETFRERVHAVTVDDIARVARSYLRPDRLSVVLVGNAKAFVHELAGIGFSHVETIRLGDLDLTAPDFKRPGGGAGGPVAFELAAPDVRVLWARQSRPSGNAEAAGRALLERALAAKGGLDRLKAVKTVTAKASTTLMTPQGPVKAETVTSIQYPDRFRVDARVDAAAGSGAPADAEQIVQTYAGGRAWIQDRSGVHDAPPPMLEEFRASVRRDLIPLLIAAATGALTVRSVPTTAAEDRDLDAVELSGPDLEPTVLYLDRPTGLIVKQAYSMNTPGGRVAVEELLSDYRPVDGVQVAFKAVLRRAGMTVVERAITEVKLNEPLDEAIFTKPK